MNLRQITPRSLKIGWQLLKRFCRYRIGRSALRFTQEAMAETLLTRITVIQPIFSSYLYQNKLSNLRLAGKQVEKFCILPGETLSFWRCVGPPSARRGFLPGRNLVGGKLREDFGGGLCQLSGLLYHLSLLAGLDIIERHNHSTDIYREGERFTPLGADAAVVYGYRDLMVRNSLNNPLYFSIKVAEDSVTGSLHCAEELLTRDLEFRLVSKTPDEKEVITVDGDEGILSRSIYKS